MGDEPNQNEQPTVEGIRATRHSGFENSISFYPAEERERLLKTYLEKDARRELMVRNFADMVTRRKCEG